MTNDGTERADELLNQFRLTRHDLYGLLREMATGDDAMRLAGVRLLGTVKDLDAWFQRFSDYLALMENPDERIYRLNNELTIATVHLRAMSDPATMHPTIRFKTAPAVILEPDRWSERSHQAAQRVVDAYHRALERADAPSRSMWDSIERRHRPFLAAVHRRDVEMAREMLARMFQNDLVSGLGRFDSAMIPQIIALPDYSSPQIHITDAIVSLAEATGVTGVTSIEQQGVEGHTRALDVDLAALLVAIEERTGLDVSFPQVGGAYGCRVAGRFVGADGLVQSYVVHRLRQIGAETSSRIVEIGGGYGCLASIFARNGFDNYTIVDLPWVNMLQGYFLIMALPPDTVSLYGEPERRVNVRPFWAFGELADRSVDYGVNIDSLPEMGAETALRYLVDIARVVRQRFLSINQEAQSRVPGVGHQNWVLGLADTSGGLELLQRNRAWMRPGYVEEIYVPKRSATGARDNGSAP